MGGSVRIRAMRKCSTLKTSRKVCPPRPALRYRRSAAGPRAVRRRIVRSVRPAMLGSTDLSQRTYTAMMMNNAAVLSGSGVAVRVGGV